MRTVVGTLLLPDGLSPGAGTLTFIASETSNQVLEGSTSTTDVNASGYYTITLRDGRYLTYFDTPDTTKIYLGKITISNLADIALDVLLAESNPLITADVADYVDEQLIEALTGYQVIGDYLTTLYDYDDTPTTPTNLVLEVIKNELPNSLTYTLRVSWDPSLNTSGNTVKYLITYYTDISHPTSVNTTNESYDINSVAVNGVYTVKVQAYAAVNSNIPSPGTATGVITIQPSAVQALDQGTITITPGLKYITIRWDKPVTAYNYLVHIFVGDDNTFIPADSNLIYSGAAPIFNYNVEDTYDHFFKFIVQDSAGEISVVTGPIGPYAAFKISDTTIGQLMEESAITAQHLANGAIVQDKIAAHAVLASKLAVLDLTNLAENHNFTIFDEVLQTFPGWEFDGNPVLPLAADGYLELGTNANISNDLTFACSEGDKFYGAVKLSWATDAGSAQKGFLIVFLDINDLPLSSGYTASSALATPSTNLLVEGFAVAPANTIKAFIRLRTDIVNAPIEFRDVICRKGAAVLIADGEITAEKINVLDLFAQEIVVEGHLKSPAEVNNGDGLTEAGIILGASGLQLYDNAGNITVDLDPATGNAYFNGDITSGSTITGADIVGGSITGVDFSGSTFTGVTMTGSEFISTPIGSIHSLDKDTYADTTSGFFLGYDSGLYKLNIGDANDYIKWTGSNLDISRSNVVASGRFSGTWTIWSSGSAATFTIDIPTYTNVRGTTGYVHCGAIANILDIVPTMGISGSPPAGSNLGSIKTEPRIIYDNNLHVVIAPTVTVMDGDDNIRLILTFSPGPQVSYLTSLTVNYIDWELRAVI